MDINFIKVFNENFITMLANANNASISRAELGFVNSDYDFIKSMIGTICIHALENPDIFNKSQSINIINLINSISHGK